MTELDVLTIPAVWRRIAATSGSSTHLVLPEGQEVTYAETFLRARQLAAHFAGAGLISGSRIVSLLGNCRELYEFYVACGLAGAVAVPVNVMGTPREVLALATDCSAAGVVARADLVGNVPDGLALRVVVGGEVEGWQGYESVLGEPAPKHAPVLPEDPAVIIYSSGTTGLPKGIALSHFGLVRNAQLTSQALGYTSQDTLLSVLPSYSSFGFSWDFLQLALVGARLVVLSAFSPDEALELVERHGVTSIAGVPTVFVRMFSEERLQGRRLESLRLLDVGGGPVPDLLKTRIRDRFGIDVVESYGLSEISPVATVERVGSPTPPGSCGPPLPGMGVRVVDGEERDVPVGETGELLFRSETVMLGYLNNPEETATALRGGWLHSGDLGRVDEDGNVFIVDRIKELIVTSGYNVYPKEVESVLFGHPGVQSVAVVGLPDETRGDNVHAFVVPQPGVEVTVEELLAHARENLSLYKVPRGITLVDEFPLTASGKIRKFRLVEQAAVPLAGPA